MKKEELLINIKDKEDKIMVSKVLEMANTSYMKDILKYTSFLDPRERMLCEEVLNKAKIKYEEIFPFSDAEKCIIVFLPTYLEKEYLDLNEIYGCIKIGIKAQQKLSHKDYMGAIYNLGIARENIGDIFVIENGAYIFCTLKVLEYFLYNVDKVGRFEVAVNKEDVTNICNLERNYLIKDIIVKSPRIDLVASELSGIARNKLTEKIENGEIFLNYKEEYYKSTNLKEGDILVIRKVGKFKIDKFLGTTKKENLRIQIKKYVD